MQFKQRLQEAILIRRYKRFLADVTLPDQSELTIHCPNTGSMKNCQDPGCRIWYTDSGNPKRKYPCTWQIVEVADFGLVGINTALANQLVVEAITASNIAELKGYDQLQTEVAYGSQKSRIDILLTDSIPSDKRPPSCYVEVKNVSLGIGGGRAIFPDAVTLRGQKHLQELIEMRNQGHRAMLFFCVQHASIDSVAPADEIDAEYGRLLRLAAESGVEVLAYGVEFDIAGSQIELKNKLQVKL